VYIKVNIFNKNNNKNNISNQPEIQYNTSVISFLPKEKEKPHPEIQDSCA